VFALRSASPTTDGVDLRADVATASVIDVSDVPHAPPSASEPPVASDARADTTNVEPVDLDAVERDLAAVERALERLSDGTYWTDEVTGEPIPADVLAADPTTRRA
jgi:RNA polymerase-binding transcription factor DksA